MGSAKPQSALFRQSIRQRSPAAPLGASLSWQHTQQAGPHLPIRASDVGQLPRPGYLRTNPGRPRQGVSGPRKRRKRARFPHPDPSSRRFQLRRSDSTSVMLRELLVFMDRATFADRTKLRFCVSPACRVALQKTIRGLTNGAGLIPPKVTFRRHRPASLRPHLTPCSCPRPAHRPPPQTRRTFDNSLKINDREKIPHLS